MTPPGPVAMRVKVVVFRSGGVVIEPLAAGATGPTPLSMNNEVALKVVQLSKVVEL
jgi:hypothetical protein